jgi:hypothetical protein
MCMSSHLDGLEVNCYHCNNLMPRTQRLSITDASVLREKRGEVKVDEEVVTPDSHGRAISNADSSPSLQHAVNGKRRREGRGVVEGVRHSPTPPCNPDQTMRDCASAFRSLLEEYAYWIDETWVRRPCWECVHHWEDVSMVAWLIEIVHILTNGPWLPTHYLTSE